MIGQSKRTGIFREDFPEALFSKYILYSIANNLRTVIIGRINCVEVLRI